MAIIWTKYLKRWTERRKLREWDEKSKIKLIQKGKKARERWDMKVIVTDRENIIYTSKSANASS